MYTLCLNHTFSNRNCSLLQMFFSYYIYLLQIQYWFIRNYKLEYQERSKERDAQRCWERTLHFARICYIVTFERRCHWVINLFSPMHVQLLSCVRLCDSVDSGPPENHRIFWARILEWVAISSFRGSSQPRDRTWVSCVFCIVGRFLTHWDTGEARTPYRLTII